LRVEGRVWDGLSSLKLITRYYKWILCAYKGNFILCNLQPQVESFLGEIEKLDQWFEIYPEEGDAIVKFQEG